MTDQVIYEHPLNERIRTFLRLEHLFKEMNYFVSQTDEWGTRAAIESLIRIMHVFGRTDLKSEILKELERHTSKLARIRSQPGIDMQTLGQVLDNLEYVTTGVYGMNGQIGQRLRGNEFLKSIMQRSSIPGGNCAFDLPQFHYWLQQPAHVRQQQLVSWLHDLQPVREAVALLLSLTRSSATPTEETAEQGFFQRSLDTQLPTQMIRVGIDSELALFAEISGGKHRFAIRFMEAADQERPAQTQAQVPFSLTSCVI